MNTTITRTTAMHVPPVLRVAPAFVVGAAALGWAVANNGAALALAVLFVLLIAIATQYLGLRLTGIYCGVLGLCVTATALPLQLNLSVSIAGSNVHIGDIVLAVGVVLCAWSVHAPWKKPVALVLAAGTVTMGLGVGFALFRNAGLSGTLGDALIYARLFAFGVVGIVAFAYSTRTVIAASCAVLWASMFAVLGSLLFGLPITGAVGMVNSLAEGGTSTSGVLRYQIPPSLIAQGFLSVTVSLFVLGGRPSRAAWATCAPALLLATLSFSRNSVVVLALTLLVSTLIGSTWVVARRALVLATLGMVAGLSGFVLVGLFPGSGASSIAGRVSEAFSDRVISGFSSRARTSDSSLTLRDAETAYALDAVVSNPVVAFGFSVPYRPPIAGDQFWQQTGRSYVHNGHLALMVKVGAIGFGLVALLITSAIRPFLRNRREILASEPLAGALLATAAGLLVVTVWVPFANDPWSGGAVSLILAGVYVLSRRCTVASSNP